MDKSVVIVGNCVHGVGFRPFLLAKARRLGLVRFEAENVLLEGRQALSVSFGGDERDVAEFFDFCKKTHPHDADVSGVSETKAPARVLSIEVYDKILAAEQQSTMVRSGLTMIGLQGKTIGLQEKTLGLQEKTLGLQEKTLGLQEKTIEKLEEFHNDNVKRFDQADARYEKIAQNLERILEEMKEERMEARKSTERIISMISRMRPYGAVREKNPSYGEAKKVKKK